MVRSALILAAACLLAGCTPGPGVQQDATAADGDSSGPEPAAEVLSEEGHAEGEPIIVRARHAGVHLADAADLLAGIHGRSDDPEQLALTEISRNFDAARQLLEMVYKLSDSLQAKSGSLADSAEWKEAADLLTLAAQDTYDAYMASDALAKDYPEIEPLAMALDLAWNELGEIVVAMGGSVEYY